MGKLKYVYRIYNLYYIFNINMFKYYFCYNKDASKYLSIIYTSYIV